MKSLFLSGHTDPGKRRRENQDAWIARQLWSADNALLVVIDGVGGYTGGERAAAIARESIEQYMQAPKGDALTMLREAVIFANNRIVEERRKDQLLSEMCCVLTAVVADAASQSLYFVHVGDTRLYRYRNGQLQKLTRDHSFVGIREDAGEMTEEEAMQHPHRHQILREVGSALHRLDDEDFMDYGREEFLPGDHLLLCSDGLTDMITTQQITTLLSTGQSLPAKVSNLIALANDMGGNDNVTVVLLKQKPVAAGKQELPRPAQPTGAELREAKPLSLPSATALGEQQPEMADNTGGQTAVMMPVEVTRRIAPPSRIVLWVLTLLLAAAAGWYFSSPTQIALSPPERIVVDSNQGSNSVRVNHAAIPGPVAAEQFDTLRLRSTQPWTRIKAFIDSSRKTLVLLPAKNSSARFAAIGIDTGSALPGDTLLLKNIRLKDFETGIKIQVPALVRIDNLVFENVKYPFHHLVKPDSSHSSVLIMNNVKR